MIKLCSKVLLIFVLFTLSACGYFKVTTNNTLVNELSEKYKALEITKEEEEFYINQFSLWYRSFNNRELDTLIDIVVDSNFDIVKAMYNLQAAAYQLGKERSALFPSLSATTEIGYEIGSKNGYILTNENVRKPLLALGVVASYEVDIWGKNYSAYQGAKTRLLAAQEDVEGMKISTIASMMNLWINLMALRQEEILLNNKIKDSINLLNLQKSNYMAGTVEFTDILQQENLILEIRNKLKDIVVLQAELLRSINILIGKEPLDKLDIISDKLPKLNKLPSTDINIMVLSERPDVKSAFYNMIATAWEVKFATLSRLPSFTLKPQIGFNGKNFSSIVDNWLLDLGINGIMPLFTAGALYDREKAAKCLNKSSIVNYKQIVFNAINELKNAIENEYKYQEKINNINKQINLLEESTKQLLGKYLSGDGNYMDYLISNSGVMDLKITLIEQQKEFLLNRVILYRTLGVPINYRENNNEKK